MVSTIKWSFNKIRKWNPFSDVVTTTEKAHSRNSYKERESNSDTNFDQDDEEETAFKKKGKVFMNRNLLNNLNILIFLWFVLIATIAIKAKYKAEDDYACYYCCQDNGFSHKVKF